MTQQLRNGSFRPWPFRHWPFRNVPLRSTSSAPAPRPLSAGRDASYVSRPRLEAALTTALAHGDNLVVYGPSHQGKTMLLTRCLPPDSIVIECRPDFGRAQIYRVILSSLGYAVLVEKKRSGKASATVKLGVGPFGGEANAEGGLEQTMQPVTVDLKNPSEVALLISRIKNLPWLVLNNFQLLDSGTKRTLLFDLSTFAERPGMRMMVIGAWPNEDYLEELEPAMAGKFRYLQVPLWTTEELRHAAAQWSALPGHNGAGAHHLKEFLDLAAGDVSLFRALLEGAALRGDGEPAATAIQDMVIGRFRRGLSTKLQALFAERDTYVGYLALKPSVRQVINPKFVPSPDVTEGDYLRTAINPETNQPWADGGQVVLDQNNHPQYLEAPSRQPVSMNIDIAHYLLRKFHAAAQQGRHRLDLADLVAGFADYPDPPPVKLDPSRLRAVFVRFAEVQRESLIVPAMLTVDGAGQAMEIVDRRLYLYLRSVSIEDLDDLLDSALPRTMPAPRRRNKVSIDLTDAEKAALAAEPAEEPAEEPEAEPETEPETESVTQPDTKSQKESEYTADSARQ